jgi:hypothetical protein
MEKELGQRESDITVRAWKTGEANPKFEIFIVVQVKLGGALC